MEIIFHEKQDSHEMLESLARILHLFKQRFHVDQFHEVHLSLCLVNEQGEDVELVDSETSTPYRVFDVFQHGYALKGKRGQPLLHMVVNNKRR